MKKFIKWVAISILVISVLITCFFLYVDSIFKNEARQYVYKKHTIQRVDANTSRIGNNWLRKEQQGIHTL